MTLRASLLSLFLAPALAFAQVDEWSTFPSSDPPPAKTEPVTPSPAVKPPAKAPEKAPEKASEKQADQKADSPAQPMTTLDPPAESNDDAVYVVTQQERLLPGTEPHTPATWGNTWNARGNRRVSPGLVGSTGLLRTSGATLGPAGVLRFSAFGEYFNQPDFPVLDAHNVRTSGTFAVSFVPLSWLETFLAYGAAANTNSFSSPTLIQALGDVAFGVKASREWFKGFSAGAELRLQSFSGVGNQDVSRYAWGVLPKALLTYDVREAAPSVPVVLHANLGAALDGTGGLVRNHTLNTAEEFALNVNRYNRFTTSVGLEVPLTAVTPYLEYNLGVPLGVDGGELIAPNGERVAVGEAMPQTLGVGLKITAVKDLTLSTGAEFGLARTVGRGVPATPPWNLFLGAAFNVDPFQRGETKVVETIRERKVDPKVVAAAPVSARVEGIVVDAQTRKPLEGVIVAAAGTGLPPVASDVQTGRFLTHDLQPGAVTLKAARIGYKPASADVQLEAGQTANVELALEPEAKVANFVVTVVGAGKKKAPLPAEVKFEGPVKQAVNTAAGASEPSKLEVPPGKYLVTVIAEGHLAQTREVQVSEGAEMKLAFELEPQPKKRLVVIKEDKIEILQQVHFQSGKATILADSYSLLNQVVDAIVTGGVKRIRIEGHTDNRGSDKKNMELSQSRAQAVADYLIKQGIDPSRVEAVGHGETRPIAPNLTARGRELNRRVEFHIVER